MEYSFCKQEESNYCVPACLQSIIFRRTGEIIKQKDIFDKFELADQGVFLTENTLNKFLEEFNLKSKYYHPKASMYDPDEVILGSLNLNTDIMLAFYSEILYNKKKELNHTALVNKINNTGFTMTDPAYDEIKGVRIRDINKITQNNGQSGFHMINTPKNIEKLRQFY